MSIEPPWNGRPTVWKTPAQGTSLPSADIVHRITHMECSHALPCNVSTSILIVIHTKWVAFFKANEASRGDPSPVLGRPTIPGSKDTEKGRTILISDTQALGKRAFKNTGTRRPSELPIDIETTRTLDNIDQVRSVPHLSGSMIEVVSQKAEEHAAGDPSRLAARDPGVTTLAAVTRTKQGFQPLLVNGRPLKRPNQHDATRPPSEPSCESNTMSFPPA
jgi:putative transposase